MELIVAVPSIWGDVPCVVLPTLKKGDNPEEWNRKNQEWIRKLAAMSSPSPPPEAA